ncbi:S8 family peptidase [Microcoleus sp. herbarium2]|uniref:S8 family peptidase n=1 Tax=Microcoleus sp. herbarium2 TaxID=3055433 RepID=UPI002FD254D1
MATNFSSDRVIVKLRPGASSSEITNLQAEIGVTKVTRASQFGIDVWQIPSGNVEETISAYENDSRVEYIEPDYIITLDDVETTSPTQENLATITPQITTPNDPAYPLLWGLNNTGQSGGTPDADIDAPEAWDIQTGNPNTVIGVLDTGVDYNHPDLVDNIWTNPGETAGDGIDNDNNGYIDDVRGWDFAYNDNNPSDVDGHGTHVSGTIAGKGNNSVGVTGVAWNAKIMPLKFLNDSGSGNISDAILALNYATAKGVKLTNNSWAGGGYSQGLYDAINTAGQQGALFIAAASNDYGNNNDIAPVYPASYNLSNIISVASTTNTDGLSSFSNYGLTSVDLGAPGSDIYSTTPGGNYATYSGTSMASPHVSGGAALVWSENPTWTAQQVKNRLLETTDPISALSGRTVSGGRLNINNALGSSTPPPSIANDNFANRILLGGLPVSTTGSNIGATAEPQEPSQSGLINSVWWSWTAPTTGTVNFDTRGSNFDTYLSVFTGSDLPNLTLLGANDDGGGSLTSLVSLDATAGTTYQIAVDGWASNTGQIALNIVVPPPPNDNFANQIALTGETATTTGSNRGATGEVGEPTQSGITNSAWWSWTAPNSGIYNIDTRGSNFDTWLSVYEGSDLANLTLIGANDDGGGNLASLVSLNATAGTTYRLAVDGYSSGTGAIQLNIAPPPPPNDNFANRIALTGDSANSTGTNSGATGEVGEPAQSGQINSAWWSWTPTSSGFFQVDTIGSGSDTYLSVYNGSDLANLTLVGANDDGGGNLASLVNLNATAGTTYQIAVDGWSSRTGSINLTTTPTAPPNDNFANRIALTGETANATGSNIRATGEVGEPTQSGTTESVWWAWTAPTTGNYTFDTIGSGYDTYLSLFTGSDLPSLALVAANDDRAEDLTSRITQSVTAGTTYQIAVEGWSSRTGQINLNISPTPVGSAGADNLTETANNTLKGEVDKDPLTGATGADTLTLPFPQSYVPARVPVTDFASEKIDDLLTEGGATMNAPSIFSPAANSAVPILEKDLSPVFTDAKGALAGNQALGINSALSGVANTSPFADPYLVGVYEAKPGGF